MIYGYCGFRQTARVWTRRRRRFARPEAKGSGDGTAKMTTDSTSGEKGASPLASLTPGIFDAHA